MKHFTMQFSEIKGDCRFSGTLATDRGGHLYDSRLRHALQTSRRPLSEKELRTVEAMTALRQTARLTRQLMDRWAEKHGLSEGRLHVLFTLASAPDHQLPLGELADQLDVAAQRHGAHRSPRARRPGDTRRRSRRPPADLRASDASRWEAARGYARPRARMATQNRRRPLYRGVGSASAQLPAADRKHDRRDGVAEEERMRNDIQPPAGKPAESGHLTEGLTRWGTIGVVAGTMLALLLAALDQTIVGTAMPRIVAELNGLNYYSWVITAYLVASTIMVPIAGKLGDLFGRKPFLLAGMIGFVAASALCGQSHSMLELVTFRTIQGIFGGMLFATVFAVIGDLFPPSQRARLAGLFGAVFGLSSIVGPTAGGYITDSWGWRWVFYVNLPVGLIAVLLVVVTMPYVRSSASIRDIDFPGAGLLIAGLVPLMVALSITRDHGWTSPEVLGLLAAAALLLAIFFIVELRTDHPIVPFSLFKNSTFSVSMIVGFLTGFGMFGTIVFVPLIYQGVLGVSATNSGQLLTPMMLGLIVASTLVGQAMVRIRYYRFLGTAGIVVMLVGMWLLSQVTVTA